MREIDDYISMKEKYEKIGEKREIIFLSMSEYSTLMDCLKKELNYSIKVTDDDSEEENYRSIAFQNIAILKRYITMLENETEVTKNKLIVVPFFLNYEKDLFLHLLASSSNEHFIV